MLPCYHRSTVECWCSRTEQSPAPHTCSALLNCPSGPGLARPRLQHLNTRISLRYKSISIDPLSLIMIIASGGEVPGAGAAPAAAVAGRLLFLSDALAPDWDRRAGQRSGETGRPAPALPAVVRQASGGSILIVSKARTAVVFTACRTCHRCLTVAGIDWWIS